MRRRDALKTIGGLAGAATMARILPACGGGSDDVGITTFVYMMMENRTYDHVFGARKLMGMPGDGLTAGMTYPDLGGNQVPLFVPDTDARLCVPADPPHGWDASHEQWNNGAMDGFLRVHQEEHPGDLDALQYLTRREMPVSWALADAYTTCDRWFASVMGPTLPNRAYWHAATSLGLKANQEVLDAFGSGIPVPSIYNRLVDKGLEWRYYFGNLPVVSLIANGGPYHLDIGPSDGTGRVRRLGDPLEGVGPFFKDCAEGNLPPVVYIDPTFGENDDHPPVHPILGQELIRSIYNALAASPQWKNIMLVITYDEHGGFFDHVAPPKTVDERPEFEQCGFRVPTIVAGPYVKQNYVSSVQYDHTSALKHLQTHFGLEPLNQRMNMANDLMDCIDLDRLAAGEPADPITLPDVNRYEWPTTDMRCKSSGGFRTEPVETDMALLKQKLKEQFPG
jgi:phospholipase C